MSYVVLARKLRPIRFDDLVGQETISQTLKNAITNNRVAHAFLFSGSRGVGKTSCARILTKAVNCLAPQGADPCNQCDNCIDINNNASPDVYEIDAASNRGIDNIRELRDNVKYAPARCQYKVYIIDEAHMLTPESFNALLKTLEEPPSHVMFILATTEPHKIPQTIISRCQRYDFIRISLRKMTDYLETVTQNENIKLSRRSLELIAQQAVGGMRDALTAIDQVIGYTGTSATEEEVSQILGMMDAGSRFGFLKVLLQKQAAESIQQFNKLLQHGHDFHNILTELLESVKSLSLIQALGPAPSLFQEIPSHDLKEYEALSKTISVDEIQQIFHILLALEERIKRSSHAQICFEMAIIQITSVQPLVGVQDLIRQIQEIQKGFPPSSSGNLPVTPRPAGGQGRGESTNLPSFSAEPSPKYTTSARSTESSPSSANSAPQVRPVQQTNAEVRPPSSPMEMLKSLKESVGHSSPNQPQNTSAPLNAPPPLEVLETQPSALDSQPSPPTLEVVVPSALVQPEPSPLPLEEPDEISSEVWNALITLIQPQSPKLGALLKTALPLSLNSEKLHIAFKTQQHLQMWESTDINMFQQHLSSFFKRPLQVICNPDPMDSNQMTVMEHQREVHAQKVEQQRHSAETHPQVQNILRTFNNSQIVNIDVQET